MSRVTPRESRRMAYSGGIDGHGARLGSRVWLLAGGKCQSWTKPSPARDSPSVQLQRLEVLAKVRHDGGRVSKHGFWLNSYKPKDRSELGERQRQGSGRGALSSLYAPPPPVRLVAPPSRNCVYVKGNGIKARRLGGLRQSVGLPSSTPSVSRGRVISTASCDAGGQRGMAASHVRNGS